MEKTNEDQISVRRKNRERSPKKGGNSDHDSIPYFKSLGMEITDNLQPIKFFDNRSELVHRWAPYVQGFSATFVQSQFERYKNDYEHPLILDPFAGCGTVLVQSKLNGLRSYGTELNPLLHFVANAKLNYWDIKVERIKEVYSSLSRARKTSAPEFINSQKQFNPEVLDNLEILKGGIDSIQPTGEAVRKIKELLLVAFSAILVDCSNLVRSPCLGYKKNKMVASDAPYVLMDKKVNSIMHDLKLIQNNFKRYINTESFVYLANAKDYQYDKKFDLVITSPPYMNGLDYVMNYKIEMGWLGFADNHKSLKSIKDEMVVCDNVSKRLIKEFADNGNSYSNDWLDKITHDIEESLIRRGSYRRMDMPFIILKYFDDMYHVMKNVVTSMADNSRFILVVGDSLIADVYLPTDLLIARIGKDIGLKIESIEKARERRSGQIRSYRLRESIITLYKE
ncbi:hypothetical protein ACFLXB_08240 [Chloroflexota bacterium]